MPAAVAAEQGVVLLAHAGGVPEAATIALPLLIFAGFMAAERRARKRDQARRDERRGDDDDRADGSS